MFEIYEVMGNMVVSADKSIVELKRDWTKSLHEGFEIGKPLNEEQHFQMMILFGEFLAQEIYELGENPLVNKSLKKEYFRISDSFGHYIDRFMFYAIQCYEKGEKVEVPKNSISLIGDACSRAMQVVPQGNKVIDKFCKIHGVELI
ncbi:hypothetical protein KM800_12685 [Clostridium tyrobutyricum]|uniref:hypothetical protein n=1 Tax=Clostridium tyrobutyricum TaxID=1519 RepID=UPI001C385AAD|nr:hypothetical protein [Clostridium tyrobutyricum]MBV4420168.1 hypothetical protein [Clostridium tyrobutyricum]